MFQTGKKKIKNQKNSPINKSLIINCKYYVPFFVKESKWTIINYNTEWVKILSFNYKNNSNSFIKNAIIKNKTNVCSIDIGCKNFISLYGLDGICYKIKSDFTLIDFILQNNNLTYIEKDTKIIQLINELHIISAKFICRKYDIIYVGLVNNKRNINSQLMNSIEDNLLKIISHKEFLDVLKYYAMKYNKTLKIVEESHTSVQCGICGEKNKFSRIFDDDDSIRRKYTCAYCNKEFCRDLNASRNILIKNENIGAYIN
jgi:transposase